MVQSAINEAYTDDDAVHRPTPVTDEEHAVPPDRRPVAVEGVRRAGEVLGESETEVLRSAQPLLDALPRGGHSRDMISFGHASEIQRSGDRGDMLGAVGAGPGDGDDPRPTSYVLPPAVPVSAEINSRTAGSPS